jgi:hypothetical protein
MVPAIGKGMTVIVLVVSALPQLLVYMYLIVSVPPDTPCTTPDETVAIPVKELVQVPPDTVSVSVILVSAQTVDEPDIVPARGIGFIVSVSLVALVPQLLVTV